MIRVNVALSGRGSESLPKRKLRPTAKEVFTERWLDQRSTLVLLIHQPTY